ncbi:uncharacterized protein PFL1_00859 [Pseudozyma flocculosa PF-1]|uniref:uncharacterized protein n=1 Tax=Pseudozyma flocculosa PF-1 TaxID=1277687 RepID=UPI0004560B32|nr:uncharacterized protein PFL1_00859 [Pseudozyma flocculosa PF-1]EPQ31526.1 hypothetical protein PFL1_00859 [Pseudozyma flocculosa PF-1]
MPAQSSSHADEDHAIADTAMDTDMTAPTSLLRVDPARAVEDVDEEIFLLWTLNAMPSSDAGLGYIDPNHDSLFVRIGAHGWRSATRRSQLERPSLNDDEGDIVELSQDVTSLRSSKGNTGSVVWRSTLHLALAIRQGRLFHLDRLRHATVLELGSGTGALAAMLASRVHKWVATDQDELVPLIRRNLGRTTAAANAEACALDWFDFLRPPSTAFRDRNLERILSRFDQPNADGGGGGGGERYPDLILCADCVYNPSLFDALTATLAALTRPRHTVVVVVAEMRTDEGISDFLHAWRASLPDGGWRILSLEDRLAKGFVVFAAWRS